MKSPRSRGRRIAVVSTAISMLLAGTGVAATSAVAAPSAARPHFVLVKVGASSPAPSWTPAPGLIAAPAAVGSPNPTAEFPDWYTWNAGKVTKLQSPPPFWADTPQTPFRPEHVNGLGEVSGTATCCLMMAGFRWSSSGVPTLLRTWYGEHNGEYVTAALNDSGAAITQYWSRDGMSVGGWLIKRDGSDNVLKVAPMGGCEAADLAETDLVAGRCYVGPDYVSWVPVPAVYNGRADAQALPLPAGATGRDCTAKFISALGTRVVGECVLSTGTVGVMWSGPKWKITQQWSVASFRARDVNDLGVMLGTTGSTDQWVRWFRGVQTPLDWRGKQANQRLLHGVRFDPFGLVHAIVATTSQTGTSWQAAVLLP